MTDSTRKRLNEITLLHVDDDSNDLILFHQACLRAGVDLNIQAVSDGDQAIAYMEGEGEFADRQKHPPPGLMVLDLKMPRVNGFEVLEWARNQEKFRRMPIIVLSSSNHEVDVGRAYDSGANSYLIKPVDFSSLVGLVAALHQYWLVLNHCAEE